MQYRLLGRTDIRISAVSFGAGPISALMIGDDDVRQREVIAHAIDRGVNWFDTAATYGLGQSERSLGRALLSLRATDRIHVATKVRLMPDELRDIPGAIRRSVMSSLERLQMPRVTLLQLHNSITHSRGDEPTSLTPADVLGSGGVAETFEQLRDEGLVAHLGLTGIGQPLALTEVVRSGRFESMQVPYHLLNPSAGQRMPADFAETNYGNIIAECARQEMGVLVIRVLAGGALAGQAPSQHTFKTPFFPLDLYQRDRVRAEQIAESLGFSARLPQEAIRFAVSHPQVHSALIGFASTRQVDEAIAAVESTAPPIDWGHLWNVCYQST